MGVEGKRVGGNDMDGPRKSYPGVKAVVSSSSQVSVPAIEGPGCVRRLMGWCKGKSCFVGLFQGSILDQPQRKG